MSTITMPPPRFENPNPFQFTRDQYHRLGELGFFDGHRVELLFGEVIENYPDDPVDPSPRPFRFTQEHYSKLGELGIFDGHRVELIFGEIVEMSPINWPHRVATGLVSDALRLAFPTGFYVDVQQPLLIGASQPEPDVSVIQGSRRGLSSHPTTAVLVVEVSDTTFFTDITSKAELYATAGIADYWVLDLNGRQLHVFRDPQQLPTGLGATAYRTHQILGPTDSVCPLAAPNATIRVVDLMP